MKRSVKKISKYLAIGAGTIIALIIAFLIVLIIVIKVEGSPAIPKDAVVITDNRYQNYSSIETLRELTMVPDFPTFDSEIYEYINDNGEKEIYIKCVFNPTLPEDSVWGIRSKMRSDMYSEDSNGGMVFHRGWSRKDFMPIPNNMEEDMKVEISMFCDDNDFYVKYTRNPSFSGVDKDSLKNFLGVDLPEFTIVNFISPDVTTLQFKQPISKDAYRALEKNEWCEHKFEDDGTSFCWIRKKEPGEYSTNIWIDDQKYTASLSKNKNN